MSAATGFGKTVVCSNIIAKKKTSTLILLESSALLEQWEKALGRFLKFDYPRLDTLIMATPVAWKGIVEQYAGRPDRDYDGKRNVMIYDYVDMHIPVFDRMYAKRLKAYKRTGYKLYTTHISE